MSGFTDFWAEWPANSATYTRKGCRAECWRRWVTRGLDTDAEHIVAHVRWLKTTEDWLKQGGAFIPSPLVYLNQSRWDGAEIPPTAQELAERRAEIERRQVAASVAIATNSNPDNVRRIGDMVSGAINRRQA